MGGLVKIPKLALRSWALGAAVIVTGCSSPANQNTIGETQAAVLNVDQFLYLRCNATGWTPVEANRLQSTSDPTVFTLTYQVTQPWLATSPDQCSLTLTNQLDSFGTAQTYFSDRNPSVPIHPPGGDFLVTSTTNFNVQYPALGSYAITVNWQIGTFLISPATALAGRVTMDGALPNGTPVSGAGVAGATVQIQGFANRTAVTDSNGSYAFTGLPPGTYSASVQKTGATFTPPSASSISVTGSAGTVQNFTCAFPCGTGPTIDPDREIFVQDPSVLTDPRASNALDGPWSFRFLLEQMTPPGMTPGQFAEAFIVNFFNSQRTVDPLRRAWPTIVENGVTVPDVTRAPFRLLGIVNRVDAHAAGNGEGRFIYGVFPVDGGLAFDPNEALFTAIFEYFLPSTTAVPNRKTWASRFHDLGTTPFGATYNTKLQALTDLFTRSGVLTRTTANPAGSALNDFRISEEFLTVAGWEFREFHLLPDPATGKVDLMDTVLQQTPDNNLRNGQNGPLPDFINANSALEQVGLATLPQSLLGTISSGAFFVVPWSFPTVTSEPLRHAFAGQTCIGCHSSEANNPNLPNAPGSLTTFYQVSPLVGQVAANQSGFVKKVEIPRRISFMQNQLTCSGASCAAGAEALMGPQ